MADKVYKQPMKKAGTSVPEQERLCATWWDRICRSQSYADPHWDRFENNHRWLVSQNMISLDSNGEVSVNLPDWCAEGSGYYTNINRLLPQIATQRASLSFRTPWVRQRTRKPLGEMAQMQSKIVEYAANYVLRAPQLEFEHHQKAFIVSMLIAYGAWKVSFAPDTETPEKPEKKTGRIEVTSDGRIEVLGGIPKLGEDEDSLVADEDDDEQVELDTFLPGDLFKLQWVNWRNLLHDPEGGMFFRDHAYCIEKKIVRLDDFKRDPKWRNKRDIEKAAIHIDELLARGESALMAGISRARDGLQHGPLHRTTDESIMDDGKRLVLYEIWDFRHKETQYLVQNHKLLVTPVNNAIPGWVDHSPYEFAMLHRHLGEWYPMTEAEAFIETNRNYNMRMSLKLTHTLRGNRKYEVAEDDIRDEELDKLASNHDGVYAKSKTGQAIKAIVEPPFDPSIYADLNQDIADGSEATGTLPGGRAASGIDSATESALMGRTAQSRDDERKAIYASSLSRIVDKLVDNLQANLETVMAIAIAGPDGANWEQRVGRGDIQGDYESFVEISELGPPDMALKLARLNQAATVMGPVIWRVRPWVERYLRELEADDPELVDAIVQEYQKVQAEALIQQEIRQGGLRGVGAQGSSGSGTGAGAGGGQNGGRAQGRAERARA